MGIEKAFPFKGVDFGNMDIFLNDTERMIRDTTRAFVEHEVMPVITGHFEAGTFPLDLVPKMGEMGLFGPTLEGYGCDEAISSVAYGLMMQALESGDSGFRSFASVQGALVMFPIWAFGTEAQKQRWLPLLREGKAIGCFGLTEPEAGSAPDRMLTTARRDGNKYILNGQKMWITNGSIADVAVVWAKVDGEVKGFLVERGTPGFTAHDQHGKAALRASITSELSFMDCHIPAENALPGAQRISAAYKCLSQARYGIGWGVIGAAMSCYDLALQYTKMRRVADGELLAGKQLTQSDLAAMLVKITKAQSFALQLGRLKDMKHKNDPANVMGQLTYPQVSMLKMSNAKMARKIARRCVELLGANGIMYEYAAVRHMNNLEAVNTYEGTRVIHTLILGQHSTGIPAF